MGKRDEAGGLGRGSELERRWRRHVTAWRAQGVSARAYCEEHGLSVSSLYGWSRKLAARDAEQSSGASARFVAVEVCPDPVATNGACIEVAPDGTIRIPIALDAERLAAVLHVARQAPAC